jgi:4-amino-4-deoxy-L-arabinose transferase-like glycosyltransferase
MINKVYIIILITIIGLGIYLRFWHLDTNPVWYGDECIYAAVTKNLLHHQLRFESLNWTFFSAYLPQPPLLFCLSAIALTIVKNGILAVRIIAALAGIGTMLLLYLIGKEIQNKQTGLWACFLFTIYPLAIAYTRWAFPYPLGMFWIMFTVYLCFRYLNTKSDKYLYFAGITAALALLTIYYAVELVLFLLAMMLFLKVDWKRIIAVMSIVVIPLILLLVAMFVIDRQSVLFDLRSLIWRGSLELGPKHSFWYILAGYKTLWLLDTFMFFGIIGLFFTKRQYQPYLWLGFGCLSILPIARQGVFLDIFFYPMVICLPFIILGFASFIVDFISKSGIWIDLGIAKLPTLTGFTKKMMHAVPLSIILIILIPVGMRDIRRVNTIFVTKLNYFANRNIQDTIATAEYLNQHTQ